jgi:hypothetical protein
VKNKRIKVREAVGRSLLVHREGQSTATDEINGEEKGVGGMKMNLGE